MYNTRTPQGRRKELTMLINEDPMHINKILDLYEQVKIDEDSQIINDAIAHYGEPAQVVKAIEELAELGLSLSCTVTAENQYFIADMVQVVARLNDLVDLCKYELPSTTSEFELYTAKHDNVKAVVSELADVSIMLDQLRKIFDPTGEEFPKAREFKLKRLQDRMDGGDSE